MRYRLTALATITLLLVGAWTLVHGDEGWQIPEEAQALENPHENNPENLAAAKATYGKKCAACHGLNGDGKGKVAVRMGIHASSFKNAEHMAGMTDGELFFKITEGRDPMPSFEKKLQKKDRWLIVHYLRTFSAESKDGGAQN